MKLIKTEDAVGHVLCHDITQIIRGVTKDAVFRKGHIVAAEDIPVLLSVGKEHLYVWEKDDTKWHENEAAEILYEICAGEHMHPSGVKEGKIELIADCEGVLKINTEKLNAVNSLGEMMIASRHGNFPVKTGDKIAGTRIIPLVIEEEKMQKACEVAGKEPIFRILPYQKKKAGIVTTGSEVYYHRIEDKFTPVVIEKLKECGVTEVKQIQCNDDHEMITEAIQTLIEDGSDLIVCTGGMSVDPDDRTPLAIKNACTEVVTYGAPVLPGAMFMLAYCEKEGRQIPVMGLPGCVMYAKRTIFDLVLPRIMCDEKLHEKDFRFTLTTNGVLLNDDIMEFANKEMDNVVLSIDGRKEVNDRMRPFRKGAGSYDLIVPKFQKLAESRNQERYYVRGTYTHFNTDFSKDVLHLADLGFKQISVEPVVAQPTDEYALQEEDLPVLFEEYDKLAAEMVRRNREGNSFNFFHFMIDLEGGPCVYKRLSGCGSGTEYLAVTPWGDLYPCHQFVGNEDFLMGNVWDGVKNTNLQDEFKCCNVYAKEKCRKCFARFYCSGGCAANSYNFHGTITDAYDLGCELQKKRIECAIMIKAAEAEN